MNGWIPQVWKTLQMSYVFNSKVIHIEVANKYIGGYLNPGMFPKAGCFLTRPNMFLTRPLSVDQMSTWMFWTGPNTANRIICDINFQCIDSGFPTGPSRRPLFQCSYVRVCTVGQELSRLQLSRDPVEPPGKPACICIGDLQNKQGFISDFGLSAVGVWQEMQCTSVPVGAWN